MQQEDVKAKGIVSVTTVDMKPSSQTWTTYSAILASTDRVFICNTAVTTSSTSYSAENSLISTMALICVMAALHFDTNLI